MRGKMGRRTKLTPDVQNRIAQAIQLGATYEQAANYGGVHYTTFGEWMRRGAAAKAGKFRSFYETIKDAEGKSVVGWLAKIEKAANDGSWQAAAWKLERRYPGDYGRQRIEHTGKDGGAIVVNWDATDND